GRTRTMSDTSLPPRAADHAAATRGSGSEEADLDGLHAQALTGQAGDAGGAGEALPAEVLHVRAVAQPPVEHARVVDPDRLDAQAAPDRAGGGAVADYRLPADALHVRLVADAADLIGADDLQRFHPQ